MADRLLTEIQQHLPDATPEQVERFAIQVQRLEKLEDYFVSYPEDKENSQNLLARVQKALNYQRAYRIAVIGASGVGKSTLNNAFLGDDLLLARSGASATGAVLEIFLDLPETQPKKAVVSYRDEFNIRELISNFIQRFQPYGIDTSKLNGNLDISFANIMAALEPVHKIIDREARNSYVNLREALADIVKQYANNDISKLRREFSLENLRDIEELKILTDENSSFNAETSPTRVIGLLKTVTYHLHASQHNIGVQKLQLPKNVCLVDLPGLDGKALHNIIIREGIKDADAVIYIQKGRIDTNNDSNLLSDVREYISLTGSVDSHEGVFFVVNARDGITEDNVPANLAEDMRNQIEKFLPDYTKHPYLSNRSGEGHPYFLISAWAALQSQKALNKIPVKEINTYESIKRKLGVENGSDYQVLQASQVPKLVEEITKFVRDRRIEGQIRDGRIAIDMIVDSLYNKYKIELSQRTSNRGEYYFQEQEDEFLKKRQEDVERQLIKFRMDVELKHIDSRFQQLENQAKNICDEIDQELVEKMPIFWQNNFYSSYDRLTSGQLGKPLFEPILTETQINLWDKLNYRVPSLANYLVRVYSESLQAYHIPERIADSCYKQLTEIESTIKELIDNNMRRTMVEVSRRIAMTKMTNPDTYFTAINLEGRPEKQQLFTILSNIPFQPDVSSHDFQQFIKQIRQEYESFVTGYCVICVLNLYRYEMIQIENSLLSLIKDIFRGIRNADDTLLKAKIRDSLKLDKDWQQIELLAQKIDTLLVIKEFRALI